MNDSHFQYPNLNGQDAEDTRLLSDFTEEDWTHLSRFAGRRTYRTGEVVIAQGSTDRALFIILSGSVDVVVRGALKNKPIAHISGGSMFGELAFFDGQPRSADIVAREVTDVLVLDRGSFDRFSAWYPRPALKMMKGLAFILSQRVRSSSTGL